MVTEVVLVLDMVGKVGRAAIQYKITSKTLGAPCSAAHFCQGWRRAPTCHTTAILWLQSRCVGNTISIVPAEHDQPLVTARLNSSLGCERHVRTWVEVKVHLAYLGERGDGIRLTCHGWLKLCLVTNVIFVVICPLALASLRASLDDSMLK